MSIKKVYGIFGGIFCILLALLLFVGHLYKNTKKELDRANSNVSALVSEVDSFRTKNAELVSVTQNLQFTIDEVEKYNSDLVSNLKSVGVKLKNAKSVSDGVVTVHVTDTILLDKKSGVYSGVYTDTWTVAKFEVQDSLLSFDYTTKDSLMIVLYGQKERFRILHPFRKRKTSYYTLAKLTRPSGSLVVKSVQFK